MFIMRILIMAITCLVVLSACSSKKKEGMGEEIAPGIVDGPLGLPPNAGSDGGAIEGLYSINFPFDQVQLSREAEQKLRKNAQWMQNNPNKSLQIEGHCDSRGSIEYNLTLGERRARKVKAYLVSNGVAAERLSILSYGEEKPLDAADTEEAHATNRRANFVPLTE
jgi:peptidoglycan-associated lipoprotein